MLELAVIADDLTGAADTGVQFCPYFRPLILTSYRTLPEGLDHRGCQALALYTNSRSLAAGSARERIGPLARALCAFHPRRIFKKIDSCLRGNLGTEIDAVLDEMAFDLSFIAPAFPEMGRSTLHGVHRLGGTPIAETEVARDPTAPVKESRLSYRVAAQTSHRVGHVDVHFLDGDDLLDGEIARLVDSGVRHVTFDATCQAHLNRIAQCGLHSEKRILLVGSAGLAGSVGTYLGEQRIGTEDGVLPIREGNHLLICGTPSDRTALQVSVLAETYPYEIVAVSPVELLEPSRSVCLGPKVTLAQALLSKKHLIVRMDRAQNVRTGRSVTGFPRKPEQIVVGLGRFAASILAKVSPAMLFLSGGDTADAVLTAVGAKGLLLRKEILPGVAFGELIGTEMAGLPVVTKAGAFGDKQTLVALHECFSVGARREENERSA